MGKGSPVALEANSEAIIRLAWCRRLGLPDDALDDASAVDGGDRTERITVVQNDPDAGIGLVRLWGTTILIGPDAMLDAAEDCTDAELLEPNRLAGLPGVSGRRLRERAALGYADDYRGSGGSRPLVSDEPGAAVALEGRCPPDDWIDLGFAELPARYVVLDEADAQRPIAGGGYAEEGPLLARLAVLVAPTHRRQGLGTTIGSIALGGALDAGLVVESMVSVSNVGGRALSESLGFSGVGCRIWSGW